MNVLFVTWDGPQVSYLEGLFLPIFRGLADCGFSFHVLQFSWGSKGIAARAQSACEVAGIPYRLARVWRKPMAAGSLLTAVRGVRSIVRAKRDWGIDVIMPRSTLSALSTLLALRRLRIPMVFDADGLALDERVDFGGQSATGLVYRLLRDTEAQAVRRSSVVLTRSVAAGLILQARAGAGTSVDRFRVVGNGRDARQFQPGNSLTRQSVRNSLHIGGTTPLIVYAGSLGEQYCLPKMLALFDQARSLRSDTHFLILTGSPELVEDALSRYPHLAPSITVLTVAPLEVARYLAAADLGLAFRQKSFSMQGVAPIKIGEYLLCGLPVAATTGIGDSEVLPREVSCLLDDLDTKSIERTARWFVETVMPQRDLFRRQCRKAGLESFSLDSSVESYRRALAPLRELNLPLEAGMKVSDSD